MARNTTWGAMLGAFAVCATALVARAQPAPTAPSTDAPRSTDASLAGPLASPAAPPPTPSNDPAAAPTTEAAPSADAAPSTDASPAAPTDTRAAVRLAGPTWDWPPSAPSSPRKHGFYLRQFVGFGFARARFGSGMDAVGLAGGTAVGAGLTQQLVLFAEISVGDGFRGARYDRDSVLAAGTFGPGLAYFLLQPRIYVSAALGPSVGLRAYEAYRDMRLHIRLTSLGIGASVAVGEEWPIDGGPLGIGVAIVAQHASFAHGYFDWFGLVASATYY